MADEALQGNAADREQQRKARRTVKQRRTRELADLREVLSTSTGRRFVHRILFELCDFLRPKMGNEQSMYFVSGQRYPAEMLMRDINEIGPDSYAKMIQEAGR